MRGKNHECLGMTLDFDTAKNSCTTSKCDLVKKLHMSAPNYLRGKCRMTEVPDFLFKVFPKAELFKPKKQDQHNETNTKSFYG